jgi:hypothetical protein
MLAAAGAAPLTGRRARARRRPLHVTRTFHVAGARYQKVPTPPAAGDPLFLERGDWQGELSLAIVTAAGSCIGFVPRSMVAAVDRLTSPTLSLVEANLDAVPWRRYAVTLSSAS